MKIDIDKEYIISLKTIEEYKELLKIAPCYTGAGIKRWREYQDDNSFALRVENGEIKGFDSFNNYKNDITYKDHIFITMADLKNKNDMENFKVGDEVRITDKEMVYSRYNDWAEMVKAKNWRLGFAPNNGSIGKITKLAEHTLESKTIALVDIDGTDVIIALKGFELITRPKSFDSPEVGDVYSNENCKRTVLGVAGRVIFMSGENPANYDDAYTKEDLIDAGYKVEKEVEETKTEKLIRLIEELKIELKK